MSQKINVNTTPGQFMPTLYYSQGDIGREFEIALLSSDGWAIPAGATVEMVATKPSGFGFTVSGTLSGNVATFETTETMTNEWGRFPAEIRISSSGDVIGTANFYLSGERDPHPAETIDGDAEEIIPELTLLVERVEAAASSVLDMTVVANTLPAGSDATYSYDEETNTATFGIPKGADGSLASGVLAPTYSSSSTYAVGDYVYYSGNLYRCTTAITTAEAWTSGHWTQVAIAPEVSDVKSALTNETNARILLAGRVTTAEGDIDTLETHKVAQPLDEYNQPTDGTSGQSLRTNGNGTTEWADVGLPTDAQTAQAVSDWLDDHPEATTTVQDGSLTEAKLSDALKLKTIKDYVTPEMFGAKGDGTTDDTTAIQDAIDFCSSEGYVLKFNKKTYRIKKVGSFTDGFGTTVNYSLVLSSNLVIDGNEATLINSDIDHASFFTNYTSAVENVVIRNLKFSMPNNSQAFNKDAYTIGVHLYDFANVVLENLIFDTFYGRCIDVLAGADLRVHNIVMKDITGHGLSIGKGASTGVLDRFVVKKANIKNIAVINQDEVSGVSATNPIVATLVDSKAEDIYCENCAWGIKFENNCKTLYIDNVMFIGGAKTTVNTGLKIQGESNNVSYPQDIVIGKVVIKDISVASAYPFYVYNSENITVDSINVINCVAPVTVIGRKVHIKSITAHDCAQTLYIPVNTYSGHTDFDNITIYKTSDYTIAPVIDSYGDTNYGKIVQICLNPTANTVQRAMLISSSISAFNPHVESLEFDISNKPYFQLPVTATIGKIVGFGKDKAKFKALLNKNATSTTITNLLSFNTAMSGGTKIVTLPKYAIITAGVTVSSIIASDGSVTINHSLTDSSDDTYIYLDLSDVYIS